MTKLSHLAVSYFKRRRERFFLTLALGIIGGFLFSWITAPLPWMLGPIALISLSAVGGIPLFIPNWLRNLVSSVIGLMLGSAFTPEMIGNMPNWFFSLCALLLLGITTTALSAFYFRKVGRYDLASAYFSAAPGGLSDMTIIGGAMGGNETLISLSHTVRLLTVISFIPFWFRISHGYINPGMTATMGTLFDFRGIDVAILAGCAGVGYGLARLIRMPAPYLMGPLLLSAGVHGAGLTQAHPPGELVIVAQLVLGCAIGCRFSGIHLRSMLRPFIVSAVAAILMLACCLLSVSGIWWATSIADFMTLFLAFSPGGLSEMAIITITLGGDVAFVSTHHFVRIFAVLLVAPLAFRIVPAFIRMIRRTDPPPPAT